MASVSRATIEKLIHDLEQLRDVESAVKQLIDSGAAAIEPLRRFLIEGTPGVTYQPRQCAVNALAGLGARDALIQYLRKDWNITDPAITLAEEAVRITAARALKPWASEKDVVDLMLQELEAMPQPGAIETLGEARRIEALPYMIKALEDDVCRRSAQEALLKFGGQARDALMDAALLHAPSWKEEAPSSLLRRKSALELLPKFLLPRNCWRALRAGLREKDAGIVIATARLAAKPGCGNLEDKREAVVRLMELQPRVDSLMQQEIEECLSLLLGQHQARGPVRKRY